MVLNDPRLICPTCGKLVGPDVERFEDLFETPADAAAAGPVFHAECIDGPGFRAWLARQQRMVRVYEYEDGGTGPPAPDEPRPRPFV